MIVSIPRGTSLRRTRDLLDEIARDRLGYALKYWQRNGAARLLTGIDVLTLAETGGGKSAIFWLYAFARPEEVILVISPLKMLEKNMVDRLERNGIRATGLNADSLAAAEDQGRDIWNECKNGTYQVILCSPEQLASDGMDKLLDNHEFKARVGLVVVDEAHLIPIWGGKVPGQREFRRAFLSIGSLRSRLSTRTVFLALSATLMPGPELKTVEDSLGLRGDRYYPIKLNCERKNLKIILRRINDSVSTGTFADLDWLLAKCRTATEYDPSQIPKTIIYVDNIVQGHQIVAYLQKLLPAPFQPHSPQIIRLLHASTCLQCKDEIYDDFSTTNGVSDLRIVVAIEAFGCGIDIDDIEQVVVFGTPRSLNSALQRIGRSGRKLAICLGVIYINPQTWDAIAKARPPRPGEDKSKLCKHFQSVLETQLKDECITRCIRGLYTHRSDDSGSKSESEEEAPEDVEDHSERCMRCSGCIKDIPPEPWSAQTTAEGTQSTSRRKRKPRKPRKPDPVPKSAHRGPGRLTAAMSARNRERLDKIVRRVWLSVPATEANHFDSSNALISVGESALILRYIRDLETPELIRTLLGKEWVFWDSHGPQLAEAILGLRKTVIDELVEEKKQKAMDVDVEDQEQEVIAVEDATQEDMDGGSGSDSEDHYSDNLEGAFIQDTNCPHRGEPGADGNKQSSTNTPEGQRYTIRIPAGAFKWRALNPGND